MVSKSKAQPSHCSLHFGIWGLTLGFGDLDNNNRELIVQSSECVTKERIKALLFRPQLVFVRLRTKHGLCLQKEEISRSSKRGNKY